MDLLKGVLMLLVMGGHVMEIRGSHMMALWIGSGFRMPLMIAISGYLLNVPRIRAETGGTLLRRYGRRMLLPWAVAMMVYVIAGHVPLDWTAPVDLLLRPPFHLWYVPVLFCLILATRLLPLSPLTLLALGAPLSLSIMYGFGLGHGPVGEGWLAPDSRFLRYPIYFFFGMLLAERAVSPRALWPAFLTGGLGLFWWAGLRGDGNHLAYVPARLLMCLGIIALLPAVGTQRWNWAPLNAIGRDSLFYYLWHPLVIGVIMMTGIGPLATLTLSVLLLLLASRLVSGSALLSLLLGGGGASSARASAAKPVRAVSAPA